jgi:hypothetical protein
MIVVACESCNRVFAYSDRDEADCTCPDCDNGPFYDWYTIVSANDELIADGGRDGDQHMKERPLGPFSQIICVVVGHNWVDDDLLSSGYQCPRCWAMSRVLGGGYDA